MRQICLKFVMTALVFATIAFAQQDGPYKVLKSARVGGEGGWDYIFADTVGRRLYILRGGSEGCGGDRYDCGSASRGRAPDGVRSRHA